MQNNLRIGIVLDLVSQVRNAILMNIFGCEKPQGVGILEQGVYEQGEGNGEFSLRATWERGGRILSQQGGFQVSEGKLKGSKRESSGGDKKARGLCHAYCNLYSCT
jgi:hypothetical protein